MKFKKFYRGIIINFKYDIERLLLLEFLILFFIFLIAYNSDMSNIEFLETIFMLRYTSPMFIGLYSVFMGLIISIFFKYIDIINLTNLKEFALRINNNKYIKKVLSISIIGTITLFISLICLISVILSLFLKQENIEYLKLFITFIIYMVFFIFITFFYYLSYIYNFNKDIAYVLFMVLHFNNIFNLVKWLAIPKILLEFKIFYCILSFGIYIFSCILIYILSLKYH